MTVEFNQVVDLPQCEMDDSPSHSFGAPKKGYVLSTAAEKFGRPIREAVALLASSFPVAPASEEWERLYACRTIEPGTGDGRDVVVMGAWVLVASWLVGVAVKAFPVNATLTEAESWFLGSACKPGLSALVPPSVLYQTECQLQTEIDPVVVVDLLPYILDPHGEGSRLSVRRRPETHESRTRKRAEGVFYTPTDVASYMAKESLRGLRGSRVRLTCLDPACGTGVFLRAFLHQVCKANPSVDKFDFASSSLFGTDIDPWVVCASAFVLLADCFDSASINDVPPVAAWHALRMNHAQVDALRLDPGKTPEIHDRILKDRAECRSFLMAGHIPPPVGVAFAASSFPIQSMFPELGDGPNLVMGNPPYAEMGDACDMLSCLSRFETLAGATRTVADMYPLFVEQMIRLTAPNAHGGAMVLPLSLACNTGRQFISLRALLARTPGQWRFAFFDREPHALFGEDVKTRNAIVFWAGKGDEPTVKFATGPLRKWRGHNRARMLESISFTPIDADIIPGIPKIHGLRQAEAFSGLTTNGISLEECRVKFGRATLIETPDFEDDVLFVGPTAYNFLNVFMSPQGLVQATDGELSSNPLHVVRAASRADAFALLAVLSSTLAFWLWHVQGDGFHVSRSFLESLPLGRALKEKESADKLVKLGESLWAKIKNDPIVSLNSGKISLGFNSASTPEQKAINEVLIHCHGLEQSFTDELDQFLFSVTKATLIH